MDDIRSKAAQALEEAADAFESGKLQWIQGSMGWQQYGTACARGGLFHALTGSQRLISSVEAERGARSIAIVAERAMGFDDVPRIGSCCTLTAWNDVPERTVDEVIDRMKEGAKRLRNGEPID
jgi:hypothetical protein